MWMYYLEVNFILIVYILAFIGAIVMLFLSVVLMLPSSTFNSQSFLPVLTLLLEAEEGLHYLLKNIMYFAVLNVFLLIAMYVVAVASDILAEFFNLIYRYSKRWVINFNKERVMKSLKKSAISS